MMEIVYQPKGSMCLSCKKFNDDCSKLDFSSMRQIERQDAYTIIVSCSERVRDQ